MHGNKRSVEYLDYRSFAVTTSNLLECVKIGIEQAPSATYRIKGDGNCFFRSLSQVLTGSQDVHQEVRLLVTSFMEHNATIPEFAGMLVSNESMEQYLKRTKM